MRRLARSGLWRWALLALLVAGACWAGNLTLFNWWAAGGPPTPQPEVYEQRGNLFFALTVALLLLALLLVVVNLRRSRAARTKIGGTGSTANSANAQSSGELVE